MPAIVPRHRPPLFSATRDLSKPVAVAAAQFVPNFRRSPGTLVAFSSIMTAKSIVRSTGRWLGFGVGLAAVSYLTYAGYAWLRYGDVRPATRPEERDALLDRFMPVYEVAERHHVRINAPADITFEAAGAINLQQSRIARAIFKARDWIMRSHPAPQPERGSFVAQMRGIGWGVLAEVPGREIVMGAVTQPWMADVVFRPLPPENFKAFHDPDYVKIVWTLRADPVGPAESIFRTETRVVATDPVARAKFRRYWSFASPGIIVIRWVLLGPLKANAERHARGALGPERAGFNTEGAAYDRQDVLGVVQSRRRERRGEDQEFAS
jgi:hypothetical protein